MNYRVLFLAAIALSNFVFAATNNSLIDRFKQDLFFCQRRLITDEKLYYQFINPYIQEASSCLVIIKYISTESLTWSSYAEYLRSPIYDYEQALINFNCAYFNAYVRGETVSSALMRAKQKLRDSIVRIKQEIVLSNSDLDVNEEFNKTIKLFQRANVAYYQKLTRFQKLKIKIANIF